VLVKFKPRLRTSTVSMCLRPPLVLSEALQIQDSMKKEHESLNHNVKAEVTFPLCLINHHAMKTYGGVEV
jgi:hypothetical protein